MDEGYLTEKNLGEALKLIFPKGEWIHNKTIPQSGYRFRPDYRNDYYKLVVEYDGDGHYTKARIACEDPKRWAVISELGYTPIPIPYFIQIDETFYENWFERHGGISQGLEFSDFPHGFISKDSVLPADFCTMGILRFHEEMSRMHEIYSASVMASLLLKAESLGEDLVFPRADMSCGRPLL